jgi:hypothetical protein
LTASDGHAGRSGGQGKHRPVATVELDEVVAADDVARVARHCDYEIEGDVAGQHVEQVVTVNESRKALLNDPKERIQSAEVAHILNHSLLLRMVDSKQFWTVRSLI